MKQYKARILPEHISAVNVGATVPVILEHQIYGDVLGDVLIIDEHHGIISGEGFVVGQKLSAGSFVTGGGKHEVREVSVTTSPKFPECQILEVIE